MQAEALSRGRCWFRKGVLRRLLQQRHSSTVGLEVQHGHPGQPCGCVLTIEGSELNL
jgi:hypothetical protein